ncbi:hypothetical protein ACHAWF_019017 [Thalassiosira exigua]
MTKSPLPFLLLVLAASAAPGASAAFSAGRGFGQRPSPSNGDNAFVSFDRFRASCPADANAIRRFDASLVGGDTAGGEGDVWVAVYRSANNLPSVFVRDAFLDAMKVSTTAQGGDSETLVSATFSSSSGVVISAGNGGSDDDSTNESSKTKPVAVARLGKGKDANSKSYIIDSMRCVLKKENTDAECDGGSEHAEAIGMCIDELVISYLQQCVEGLGGGENEMVFDGGIRFRGTLVSGKLLDSRGFREVSELSPDMHSHESDYDGALAKYAERSTSLEIAKNPGARDRALKVLSYLGRLNRDEDRMRAKQYESGRGEDEEGSEDGEENDFDPWASVKRYL